MLMISYDPQKISNYWSKSIKTIIPKFILLQVFSMLLVAALLWFFTNLNYMDLNFWLALLVYSIIYSLVFAWVVYIVIKPQRDLLALISQISNDSVAAKMPDVNSSSYTKSGFSEVLKFIYSLDQTSAIVTKKDEGYHAEGDKLALMDNSHISLMFLNKNNEVVFKNSLTPDLNDLVFTNQTPLLKWLKEVRKHKISAEMAWTRIPDSTADNDDRRIFDVFASYKKGDSEDVAILFIDRTKAYIPDEDDLNFIAFAAHELRGPITIIRGYLDVLSLELGDSLSSEQAELFDRLIVSANKLSGYINNILNVSRFDRQRLGFDLSEHSVLEVVDSVRDDVDLRATSQNRILEINISDSLPSVAADLSSMSEVLTNVIDNAIKYSNEGGIVKVYADQVGDFVDIHVVDYGIGIPSNVMSNLFHKFYRSHRSRETVAGTGIGLYISRAIVEGHGGQISVKSIEGEGSTFTISLPTYASIKDRLLNGDGDIIKQPGGGWIKNHGKIRS